MSFLHTQKISGKYSAFFSHPIAGLVIYLLAATATTIRQFLLGTTAEGYTFYNNYLIFKNAFWHLLAYKDLYIFHNDVQFDLYKYSPTFAVCMAPFALLPDFLGLLGWNVLNVVVLWWGVQRLKLPFEKYIAWAALFICQELITNLINSQSNALIAGLMVLGFTLVVEEKHKWGTLCWVAACFIKPFAAVMFLYFFFANKKKSFFIWCLVWGITMLALPLLFVSMEQYMFLLKSWQNLLSNDHSTSFGYSVMGLLNNFFDVAPYKTTVVIIGLAVMLVPMVKFHYYNNHHFQLLMLASLLIWVTIFNHKAESPTFVIAVAGVAVWYWTAAKRTYWDYALLIFVFVLTQLSPTDLFPAFVRKEIIQPYSLKALPCVVVWVKIVGELLFFSDNEIIPVQAKF